MAQKTNLNINPYYDDFDADKNFYKVLFKPGFPVQSRELTTLQSLMQNQVESFASHTFKEGSVIIPGNLTYDNQFYAVKLNSTQFGTDISLYIEKYIGKVIQGQVSGVTAKVQKVVFPTESDDVEYITLYVKYLSSDNNFEFSQFSNGETLTGLENVVYGNTTISAGVPFASAISTDATAIGSAVSIGDGVYFIRGYFVRVTEETILLDYYTNIPSYRVGLKITEDIVDAKEDASLYDNAKGFSNYTAPGADRLKITVSLFKKPLSDKNDIDFVELLKLRDGKTQKITTKTQYNVIRDYFAERTFDESGDYTVNPFDVTTHELLNNRLGNDGLFFSDQKTDQGNTPSEEFFGVKVSSGKAYVKGYDIEKIGTTIIDVKKPRDTEKVENIPTPLDMGSILRVNNVTRLPELRKTIDLYGQLGSTTNKIGEARVYSFNLTDSAYSNDSTSWDLRLYDIQTYTTLTTNTNISVLESDFVVGKSSGASGYVVSDSTDNVFQIRQTSGAFAKGEQLSINGVDVSISLTEIRVYNTQNIKSVKQTNSLFGSSLDFTADSILDTFNFPNSISQISITAESGGISTVTSTGRVFTGIRTDTIVRYQSVGLSTETFNRVSSVSADGTSLEISGISSVTGVFEGALPTSDIQVNGFLGAPIVRGSSALFAPLSNQNVSEIDLSSSSIFIIDQVTGQNVDTNDSITINPSDITGVTDISLVSFDQERYGIGYSGGTIAPLSSDSATLSGSNISFTGLDQSLSSSDTVVNVTALKNKIQSKVKNHTRSSIVNITRSKLAESGSNSNTSLNDGLTYNRYNGLRVQDREISLNYPDVTKIICVYESLNSNAPQLDVVSFTSTANVNSNAVIGENIIGSTSKAIARVVTNNSTTSPLTGNNNKLGIVYLNANKFVVGETVTFEESNITTTIESITLGSFLDLTANYALDKGQRDEYYDYSRIVRNSGTSEPSRKLLVVFDHYTVPSTDTGDVFTVASYDDERFATDIPEIGLFLTRASDTLDFRPRVSYFDPSVTTDKSPFDFGSRTSSFNTNPLRLLASGESSQVGYDFYLPRIDKVYLDSLGKIVIDSGKSSTNPSEPDRNNDLLQLATIELPAYLYDPKDAVVTLIDNRRYTMRDIGNIEDRVENLEATTSLSFLEVDTQTIQIQDSEGRNRFKSGFFVDDFENFSRLDTQISNVDVDPEVKELTPLVSRNSIESLIAPEQNTSPEDLDLGVDFELLDSNIKKTGNLLTLDYQEIDWLEQPFATKVENVNPFNVVLYIGNVDLFPQVDTWTRTFQLPDRRVTRTVTRTVRRTRVSTSNRTVNRQVNIADPNRRGQVTTSSSTSTSANVSRSSRTRSRSSTGSSREIVSRTPEIYMRSRNTEFKASELKPLTKYYQFLDNNREVDVVPKLVEISPNPQLQTYGASAAFSIGETVVGTTSDGELIRFRLCTPNHKFGSFNNPSSVFTTNPYSREEDIGSIYTSTSKVLNVDTSSLAQQAQGAYSGYLVKGMQLVGQTSGAIAYVKDIRLISDNYGDLFGTFFLKDPNTSPAPSVRIETGRKPYKITSSPTNEELLPGSTAISYAESEYDATGVFEQWRNLIVRTIVRTRTVTTRVNIVRTTTNTRTGYFDPLAQTFTVGGNVQVKSNINTEDDANGVFLTSVDLFFANIDTNNSPLRLEIRTVELGTPTLNVIGRSVTVRPTEVNASGNTITNITRSTTGDVATNIKFPEPIFLAPGKEYALVIVSENSNEYELWTAVMGEDVVRDSSLPDVNVERYTQQFSLGSLFKSQNGSIWSTDQYQDLKFKLYKAKFTENTGTAYFYNPPLDSSNGYVRTLATNPITVLPKTGKIGIVTSYDSGFIGVVTVGRKLSGVNGYGGSATVVGQGSSVATISTTESGVNYPPTLTNKVVSTYNIIGNGSGLKLVISTDSNGVISGAAHSTADPDYGTGYKVGDVVGIVTSTTGVGTARGRDAQFTITSITGLDTLYLSNVQGEFGSNAEGHEFSVQTVGAGLSYYDGGSIVSAAGTYITSSNADGGVNSGNYIRVDHFEHGMYSNTNKLILDGIQSDVSPTILSSNLLLNQTTISVGNTSNFTTFEGQTVSGSYPGYVKIGNEIIKYEGVGTGELTVATTGGRGVDNTIPINHFAGDVVEKYEFGGISLRRINGRTASIKDPIDIDSYHVEIDRSSSTGSNRAQDNSTSGLPQLSFASRKTAGGSRVTGTQNILFTGLRPTYDISLPGSQTSVDSFIRTTSGTGVSGSENSFNDAGFQPVQLNAYNPMETPRIVCSEPNQDQYLTALPRKKSFTTGVTFSSTDSNLSPVINLNTAFTEFFCDRINNPVTNYITDGRVNGIEDDPHVAVYYSNIVNLTNPATSLKVLLSAYRDSSADFRVLYSLIRADSSEIEQSFELFPGYNNLKQTTDGLLPINENQNSGLPDVRVPGSLDNEFLDYEFTADNLDLFTGFSIKIVMSTTNQAKAPRFKDLRTIAVR